MELLYFNVNIYVHFSPISCSLFSPVDFFVWFFSFSSFAVNLCSSLGFSLYLMGTGFFFILCCYCFSQSGFFFFSSFFFFSLMVTGFASSAFNVLDLAFEPLFLHTLWNTKWLFLFFSFFLSTLVC